MTNKLLIIEDDIAFASLLNRRMSKQGFSCQQCHDASQGLLVARQFNPTHILLDMKLEQ